MFIYPHSTCRFTHAMMLGFPDRAINGRLISSEQLANQFLCDLINGLLQDFTVSKTYLGSCWQCPCCIRGQQYGVCNLYACHGNLTSKAKAQALWGHHKKICF
jgi:hypothetical protein